MYNAVLDHDMLKKTGDKTLLRFFDLLNRNDKKYYPGPDEALYENELYDAFQKCEQKIYERFKEIHINLDVKDNFAPAMVAAYISKEILLQEPIKEFIPTYSKDGHKRGYVRAPLENCIYAVMFSFDIMIQFQISENIKSEKRKQKAMDLLLGKMPPNRVYDNETAMHIAKYIMTSYDKINDNFMFTLALAQIYSVVYNASVDLVELQLQALSTFP